MCIRKVTFKAADSIKYKELTKNATPWGGLNFEFKSNPSSISALARRVYKNQGLQNDAFKNDHPWRSYVFAFYVYIYIRKMKKTCFQNKWKFLGFCWNIIEMLRVLAFFNVYGPWVDSIFSKGKAYAPLFMFSGPLRFWSRIGCTSFS